MRETGLALVVCLAALLLWPVAAAPRGGALRLLVWPDAFGPHTLRDFRISTGIQVEVETVTSSEELLNRLLEGPPPDLVLSPDYLIPILRERDLLAPIDAARVRGLRHLDPRFLDRPDDPGHRYSIPHVWGVTGLAWRDDEVKTPLRSFAQALAPDQPWSGKVAMVADSREAIGAALKALGYSANSTTRQEIAEARDLLLLQPHLSILPSTAVAGRLAFGATWVSQAWSDEIHPLREKGHRELRFVVPEEGGLLWLDAFALIAGASHVDEAHQLLEYLTHPRTAAELSVGLWRATPNLAALPLLPRELRADPSVYPPTDRLNKSEFLRDVGAAGPLYDQAWAELLRAAGVRGGVR